jgi:2-oxoglutarate ferredoxin oxidoreductase subunit delta
MENDGDVVINREWCKGCGICVVFCPKEALVLEDDEKTCRERSLG